MNATKWRIFAHFSKNHVENITGDDSGGDDDAFMCRCCVVFFISKTFM